MNDFAFLFKYPLAEGRELSLIDWSFVLGRTPCGPIDMESPNRMTRRLLENPHGVRVIEGG